MFNALSWYGSRSMQDKRDLIPTDFSSSEVVTAGMYVSYSVEINIFHLSLNTIALSDELKDIDRETTLLVSDDNTLDEFVAAKTAFRVLKILVLGWLDDVYNKSDKISDQLLQNISAWVYGQASPLHEPYLGRILTRLNKKVFHYFIQKLKSLGATIVYASLSRLIISTQKQTLESAQSYVKYILETMIAQPLFKYLSLKPTHYYQLLLFKDQYNYIAYDDEPRCKLLLADYLPPKMQNLFKGFLFEYLIRTIEFRNQQDLSDLQGIQNLENALKAFQLEYVKEKLSSRLYMAVDYLKECQNKIHEEQKTQEMKGGMEVEEENRFEEEEGEDYEQDSFVVSNNELDEEPQPDQFKLGDWMIPTKIGKRYEIDHENVNLVLVNFLCKMLSVDENIEWEIRKIKGNCCRMLQISEYDKAAQFQEPTLKLILSNMVCEGCFNVADLDTFQDEWVCQNCGNDLEGIENRLCDFIENWLLFYQIQDLYCQNCKQPAVDPMKLK